MNEQFIQRLSIDFSKMERKIVRQYRDTFRRNGYVRIEKNNFYIEEMIEALGK